MRSNKIRLTESDIHKMVKECVTKILNELQLSNPSNGNPVNMMVGRFQPFTLGHLKCLQRMKQENGIPTFLFSTRGKGDEKRPFMGGLQDEMLNRIKEAYPDLIAGIEYANNAAIDIMIDVIRKNGYEPVSWTCGNDRIAMYDVMVKRYGEQLQLSPDFEVKMIDRDDDGISATKVREAILNDNRDTFMKLMPECLYDLYGRFREVLMSI